MGGDPIIGTTFVECLREFKNDPQTEALVICGEIGGSDEEDAAALRRRAHARAAGRRLRRGTQRTAR